MLTAWLDYQRATLLWKCERLDGDALVRRERAAVDRSASWASCAT